MKSSNTRSTDDLLARSSACCPFSAGMTEYPSDKSTSFRESRTVGSSSTSRILWPGRFVERERVDVVLEDVFDFTGNERTLANSKPCERNRTIVNFPMFDHR